MASSLSRSTFRTFLLKSPILKPLNFSSPFCRMSTSSGSSDSDSENSTFELGNVLNSTSPSPPPSSDSTEKPRSGFDLQLEDGVDVGIYRVHIRSDRVGLCLWVLTFFFLKKNYYYYLKLSIYSAK